MYRGSVGPRTVIVNRGYYRPYYRFVPRISLGIGLWAGYPVSWSGYYGYSPYSYGYSYPYNPYAYGYGYPAPPANYPTPYPPANYPSSSYPSTSYPSSNYPSTPYPSSSYPAPDPSGSYSSQPPNSAYPDQPPAGDVTVEPGDSSATTGGVSFEIEPATASVFVDGRYMGTGGDFGPSAQPLSLTPGRHRVEIRAEGYQSMSFDADVTAGQLTPFKATLQRR